MNPSGHFSIDLVSLSGTGPGPAANFDAFGDYHWLIASFNNDLRESDLQNIEIHRTSFANNTGNGQFSLSTDSNDLYINFSAAPEPSTVALASLASALFLRRRKQNRI